MNKEEDNNVQTKVHSVFQTEFKFHSKLIG